MTINTYIYTYIYTYVHRLRYFLYYTCTLHCIYIYIHIYIHTYIASDTFCIIHIHCTAYIYTYSYIYIRTLPPILSVLYMYIALHIYSRCPGLPASSLPVCPVYRCFFSCHPVTPVYRWYTGIPWWFIFSCSRSPSCCCTLPHTLLHTTQHNTLGVAGSSQHLPTHHAMCGRRIVPI